MKFTEKLASHLTPEWRSQYINYEELKKIFTMEDEELGTVALPVMHSQEAFFAACEAELQKVNVFFAAKLAESRRRFTALKAEIDNVATIKSITASAVNLNAVLPKNKCERYKTAFSELYLQLVLLQNYQSLNHTGFRKILKKYDKITQKDLGAKWFDQHVNTAPFYTNTEIMNMINETEQIFTNNLEGGDRSNAMKRLRVPPLAQISHPWTSFRVGYYLGVLMALIGLITVSILLDEMGASNIATCLHLYRGPFAISWFLAGISMNVHAFYKVGINHVLIFELDPRDHLMAIQILEIAAAFGVIIGISVLALIYSNRFSLPPLVHPLAVLITMVVFMINPFPILHFTARMWLIKITGRCIAAPFFYVGFADFWLGDQLNSMVAAIIDFVFTICFYARTEIKQYPVQSDNECGKKYVMIGVVRSLPAWWRFAQCLRRYRDSKQVFPHLVNAAKYSTTIIANFCGVLRAHNSKKYQNTLDNPFTWCWLGAAIVATTYGLAWDLLMDWGLFAKNAGQYKFLRDHIVYSQHWYYCAMVENVMLRFLWVPIFYIEDVQNCPLPYLGALAGQLEIFRRFIWNFFRLENEHLNNIGQFRAVRDISLKPIIVES